MLDVLFYAAIWSPLVVCVIAAVLLWRYGRES